MCYGTEFREQFICSMTSFRDFGLVQRDKKSSTLVLKVAKPNTKIYRGANDFCDTTFYGFSHCLALRFWFERDETRAL